MKNRILHWTSVLLASSTLLFAACTSDDDTNDGSTTTPVFPDVATLTIPAGETTCDITFTPNMDWTVSIPTDAETSRWFELRDGEMPVSSINGKASSTPVTVTLATVAQEIFDETPVCEVSLTMGGQTQVIAKVTRGNALRTFELYASEYNVLEEDDFTIPYVYSESALTKYTGSQSSLPYEEAPEGSVELKWPTRVGNYMYVFKTTSNFDWLISAPEWLSITQTEIDAKTGSYQITINGKFTEENIDGAVGVIDFYDANIDKDEDPGNNAHNKYCISMPSFRDIVRSRDAGATFTFDTDGNYVDMNGTVVEGYKCTGDVSSTAGLKFFVAMVEGGFYYGSSEKTDWVTVTDTWDENGEIFQTHTFTVEVTPSTSARKAILLALPKTLADQISDPDLDLLNSSGDDFKEEYKPYVLATIDQAGATSDESGFSIEVNYSTEHMVGEGKAATFEKVDSEQYFYDHMDDDYLINYYEYFMQGVPIYVLTYNSSAAEGGSVLFDIKGEFDNALAPPMDTWFHFEYMADDYNPGVSMLMIDMSQGSNGSKSNVTFTNANGSVTYAILLCYRKY